MNRFTGMLALLAMAMLLILAVVLHGYAASSDSSITYRTIAPPINGDILSVHKISDNDFYILYSNAVYHYKNGSWKKVAFSPEVSTSLRNMGGNGSTLYAVGDWGQIFKIFNNNGEEWKAQMGMPDLGNTLQDVDVASDVIVAVGQDSDDSKGAIFTGSASNENSWNQRDTGAANTKYNAVAGDGSGKFVAVGERTDTNKSYAKYSSNYGGTWNEILFSGISSSTPPLEAVSYDPNTGTFLMAGGSTSFQYWPDMNPTDSNVRALPTNCEITDMYQNYGAGQCGPMAAGAAVLVYNCGRGWSEDSSVPSGSAPFNGIHGGSDIFVVGENTILRRTEGGADAAAIPTVSEWGMIILTLVLLVMGMVFLRRNKPNAPMSMG
jgi:hypothetical protein